MVWSFLLRSAFSYAASKGVDKLLSRNTPSHPHGSLRNGFNKPEADDNNPDKTLSGMGKLGTLAMVSLLAFNMMKSKEKNKDKEDSDGLLMKLFMNLFSAIVSLFGLGVFVKPAADVGQDRPAAPDSPAPQQPR